MNSYKQNPPRYVFLKKNSLTQPAGPLPLISIYKSFSIFMNFILSPGAGKSTFIENLGMKLIKKKNRVAVIPVDPSSHISGGSILGDE